MVLGFVWCSFFAPAALPTYAPPSTDCTTVVDLQCGLQESVSVESRVVAVALMDAAGWLNPDNCDVAFGLSLKV